MKFSHYVLFLWAITTSNIWSISAEQSLRRAAEFLNTYYDYRTAIMWFEHALNAEDLDHSRMQQAYIGLAMAYHHIGQHGQRDRYMDKAQKLLHIPNNLDDYTQDMFTLNAINYLVVDGYRYYLRYENAHNNSTPLYQQEAYLYEAENVFNKALEVAQVLDIQTIEQAHAYHGLGTIYEFLSLCKKELDDRAAEKAYVKKAIQAFEHALLKRQTLLGKSHPHVARSYHKLARNYRSLALLLGSSPDDTKKYVQLADTYYQQAMHIFEENNIPKNHPKYQELEVEYSNFVKILAIDYTIAVHI